MKLAGDPDGIAELKKMQQERKDFLKYIITEAKTNTDLSSTFKSSDGSVKYKITLDRMTKEFVVSKMD